jgi:dihydrofolate reductase
MTDAKVVAHATMSLDGFIATPDDTINWIFDYVETSGAVEEEITSGAGAVLSGRLSHDAGVTKRLSGGDQSDGNVFVLTHHPPDRLRNQSVQFLSGDISAAVAAALAAADGRNLVVTGGNVVRQCLDAELIDEIVLHVVPVLLGDGVRLFQRRELNPTKLERLETTQRKTIIELRFRVIK